MHKALGLVSSMEERGEGEGEEEDDNSDVVEEEITEFCLLPLALLDKSMKITDSCSKP